MRPPKGTNLCEFIQDAAPEHFSTSKDLMMRYSVYISGEYIIGTDDASPKDMAKELREIATFCEKAANFVENKKYNGKRCS